MKVGDSKKMSILQHERKRKENGGEGKLRGNE